MTMLDNMNTIEQQVFRTYWDDGLLDVFAAVGVLAIGVAWAVDFPVGGAIVPALLVPLWAPLRQRLIEPRLGLVEFSDQRDRRNQERLRNTAIFGVGVLALVVALYLARSRLGLDLSVPLVAGLPALLLAVLALITAFLVSTPRFITYAAILAIAGIGGAWYGLEPGYILVLASVPMLVLAVSVVVRFVRSNPVS
jgi:hypothetical protein